MNGKPFSLLLFCFMGSLWGTDGNDFSETQVQVNDLDVEISQQAIIESSCARSDIADLDSAGHSQIATEGSGRVDASPQSRNPTGLSITGELLLLTSTLSTTFSDEGSLFNNNGIFPVTVDVLNEKEASIKPEYNVGFRVEALYRIPPSRNSLSLSYTYIVNKGDGRVKRNTTLVGQINIQNDHGKQRVQLQIADFLASHLFPRKGYVSFIVGGGLTFNEFDYHFSFDNQDDISNSGLTPSQFIASISSKRTVHSWGVGPKLELECDFHFTKMISPHDAAININVQMASLFGEVWAHGSTSALGTGHITGFPIFNSNVGKWSNSPKFQAIPNLNCDTAFQYKYEWANNLSLVTVLGYRAYLYWELKDFNRAINYRLNSTAFISDIETTRSSTVLFGGPYFSFTLGF